MTSFWSRVASADIYEVDKVILVEDEPVTILNIKRDIVWWKFVSLETFCVLLLLFPVITSESNLFLWDLKFYM